MEMEKQLQKKLGKDAVLPPVASLEESDYKKAGYVEGQELRNSLSSNNATAAHMAWQRDRAHNILAAAEQARYEAWQKEQAQNAALKLAESGKDAKDLTPEERMQWLRDRGILIETPEERKAQTEASNSRSSVPTETATYVLVPADANLPLQELTFGVSPDSGGDCLLEHVKPVFAKDSQKLDLGLLQQPSSMQMGSSSPENVSEDALKKVAKDGQVEIFNLVHPTPSNKFVGINIYLDEIGMLKRLPLNKRASDFAREVGYSPPPQFYGDVFLGRVHKRGATLIRNMSFPLIDTNPNSDWLQQGATQNLEYQMELNQITGRNETQPNVAGSNGVSSQEDGYTWTQTEEEVEVVAPLPNVDIKSKDIKIKFKPRHIEVFCQGEQKVSFELFEKVDVDGCTWTIDKTKGKSSVVVTMEKMEEALWPRIEN